MKVLQILTLVTPDGAYGGPARVALNQCVALAELGHEPTLVAGSQGYDQTPNSLCDIPVRLFPARRIAPGLGYAATRAPAMDGWLARNAAEFDVAHVHLARDLVTIPAARTVRRRGLPFVAQTHGMVAPGTHPLAAPIDALWTRSLLRSAGAVFHLNVQERDHLSAVAGPGLQLHPLENGIPVASAEQGDASRLDPPEVLFLARIHERKRPEVFAAAALQLLRNGIDACFTLVGPPEGAEAAVDQIIAEARDEGFDEGRLCREPALAPERTAERMRRASVYVLPAVREPFGMTIVEALAQGVPVVVNADGGLAEFVGRNGLGEVVDGGVAEYAAAIARLLADPVTARSRGAAGREAVRREYGMAAVGQTLENVYASIVGKGTR